MPKYRLFYRLTHANGAVVAEAKDPDFSFEIGDGQLDPCLERCVKSAKIGTPQTFLLTADEAFGASDEAAIVVMKKSDFAPDTKLEVDAVLDFTTPTGEPYIGIIDKLDGDDITVNFNHVLAGCDVSFYVDILEITK